MASLNPARLRRAAGGRFPTRSARLLGGALAAIDRLPFAGTLALGLLLGGGLAAAVAGLAGLAVALIVAIAAGALAYGGRPVGLVEPADAPAAQDPAADRGDRAERSEMLDLVAVPGGTFVMGSTDEDELAEESEKPAHHVTVSDFLMARTPVTRAQYLALVRPKLPAEQDDAREHPITEVSWHEAVDFCNALSAYEDGLEPCYSDEGETVRCDMSKSGYRLPTEAEWEYACRAGTTTPWHCGSDDATLTEHAWYRGNSESVLHPVGKKAPNAFGLRDMHGLVWEWCNDGYGPYSTDAATDPTGLPDGSRRVLRGGSFLDGARALRSAIRLRNEPEGRGRIVGFRCVRRSARQH